MKLSHLAAPLLTPQALAAITETDIQGLTADSRQVAPGWLFVAVRGYSADGHDYISRALEAGAAAVVCEQIPAGAADQAAAAGVQFITVPSGATALGLLASQWYGNPSRSLRLVGVTGTNGKTTTATLLYELARMLGHKAGLLSTVCNYIDGDAHPTSHTTPDPLTINRLMRRMVDRGCTFCAMEVSSHAAHQQRTAGLEFAGGVFTNLTHDHLDYHKSVDAYLRAKKSFFDSLPATAFALTNADDKTGPVMLQNTRALRRTYSLRREADFNTRILEQRLDGTLLDINGHQVEALFTGRFNAYNLTAVYGSAILLGWPQGEVLRGMSALVPVAGRFQAFHSPAGVTAIVDYAHTPDAVANVLQAIREVTGPQGNIITVVGAGGDRDKGKRPIMAAEAAARSQRVILTSDNPRTEDPEAILDDMQAGLDDQALARTLRITDRAQAIRTAVALATPGTVILIAGKGHEDYQDVGGVKHHFDDREQVRAAMGI